MKNPLTWIAIAVVVAGVAAFYHWRTAEEPAPPAVVAAPSPAAPAPAPVEPPRIQYALPEPPPGAAPLPPLADSDAVVKDTLTGLFGHEALAKFFVPDGFVRRFVATVDNLPRKTAAARLLPVRPVPGVFVVAGRDDALEIGAQNEFRYRPYVQVMEAPDAKKLVAVYVRLYPLFQTAYRELGYPDAYFNDRLIQAIDDLLAAPEIAAPRLVQPKILYQYADADLEDRSAGQKIMMRMGAENAARVKAKLRAIREEITGQMTQR